MVLFAAMILGFGGIIMEFPTRNMMANLGLPLTFIAVLSTLYNLVSSIQKSRKLQISRSILHFGIVVIMLGILLSSTNEINYGELVTLPETTLELGEFDLEFGAFELIETTALVVSSPSSSDVVPEFVGFSIPVTVNRGRSSISADAKILLYSAHGIVSRPTVIRAPGYDVYVVLHQSQNMYRALAHSLDGIPFTPGEFVVSVIYFPLMNLIWVGCLLMSIGALYPITFLKAPKKTLTSYSLIDSSI
jgi:cytochrome c biogenesis factor